MRLPSTLRRVLAFALGLAASVPLAHAASSFRIDQLFSSLDGTSQYVVLRESAGRDGEHAIGGLVLRATAGGVARDYTIPRDLSYSTTAGKAVVIGTGFGVSACCTQQQVYLLETGQLEMRWFPGGISADFKELPGRFLSLDGGTIELVGVDAWTYGPLPTSGHDALARDGSIVDAVVHPFWIAAFPYAIQLSIPVPAQVLATTVSAREYYHAGLDRYLLTANAQDIDAIERGVAAGWALVDYVAGVFTTSGPTVTGPAAAAQTYDTVPVCRYYLPPPLDTHFLSAWPEECAVIGAMPGAILESAAAFYAYLPDPVTGSCGNRYTIYRLWNGLDDANHRWTSDLERRAELVAKGWVPEGAGPLGVAFCGTYNDWDYWI